MAKANDTRIYPFDTTLSVLDYLFGTDSNDRNRNKNFRIIDILGLIESTTQAEPSLKYYFSDGSDPSISYETQGFMFTENNILDPADVTKIIFNDFTNTGEDLSQLLELIGRKENLILKLRNVINPSNFLTFNIIGSTREIGYTTVEVEQYEEINLGGFLNGNIYYFSWEINSKSDSSVFTTDFEYNLRSGDSLGKLKGTGIYPTIGKSQEQFLREIANDYISPAFTSFNISGQPTTVEVGTTLSGFKTFNWAITLNNGSVPTIDIYDNTAADTLLPSTPNDGSQTQMIITKQLNSNGATQSWKAIGNNESGANVNSANFVVTSLFYKYWGAVSRFPTVPGDGNGNRMYAEGLSKSFKTTGQNTFTLATGTTENKFIVLLPQGITITSVIDLTNLSADVTSEYILSTITIKDAGGTDRTFNMYKFSPSGTYPVSANHQIKTT